MDWTSAPGVTAVDVLQLLSIEKIFQKICIIPQCSLVKQPGSKGNLGEWIFVKGISYLPGKSSMSIRDSIVLLENLSTEYVATYCQFLLLKQSFLSESPIHNIWNIVSKFTSNVPSTDFH